MNKKDNDIILDQKILEKILNFLPVSIQLLEIVENNKLIPAWDNNKYKNLFDCKCDKSSVVELDTTSKQYYKDDRNEVKQAYQHLTKFIGSEIGLFCRLDHNGATTWIYIRACSIELFPNRRFIIKLLFPIEDNEVYNQLKIDEYAKELRSLCQRIYISKLTKSEMLVFNLLTQGNSTKEIANQLCRSYDTINNHKRSIFKKLNIHKIQDLQLLALNLQ